MSKLHLTHSTYFSTELQCTHLQISILELIYLTSYLLDSFFSQACCTALWDSLWSMCRKAALLGISLDLETNSRFLHNLLYYEICYQGKKYIYNLKFSQQLDILLKSNNNNNNNNYPFILSIIVLWLITEVIFAILRSKLANNCTLLAN